jgi:hypothetical protein
MIPDMKKPSISYVRFERRPIEDREGSLRNGHYTSKDVDYAVITPPGSKDQIPREVKAWFAYLDQQVMEERIPVEWVDRYKAAYEKWKKGEEIPLDGVAIKGWGLLSPAQQVNLIAIGIQTVEQLADLNEEMKNRIGLGAVEMQRKAKNWLDEANGPGKIVARLTAIETDMGQLKSQNDAQRSVIEALRAENLELRNKVAAAGAAQALGQTAKAA